MGEEQVRGSRLVSHQEGLMPLAGLGQAVCVLHQEPMAKPAPGKAVLLCFDLMGFGGIPGGSH